MKINIEVFFYFAQNYYFSLIEVLEIVNQLSTYLYENYDNFCERFSYYLEKSIKIFIYIKSTKFLLLVHNIQNVILDYL